MNLRLFNELDGNEAMQLLKTCCGSERWTNLMFQSFPFENEKELIVVAENKWYNECLADDWLEAFTYHPKIGDINSLKDKFASTQHLASAEQHSVNIASDKILEELATANAAYENKFGFIFIVCASGKSAPEMLRLLNDRLINSHQEELNIAMGEQHKISILRLKKIIDKGNWQSLSISHITTHVLDTSCGKPGENITIKLKKSLNQDWQTIAQGVTNKDGRIADLLPQERKLVPGNYQMVFDTERYFRENNVKGFYPEVEIQFTVLDETHYHVPLLINPFGYSTYRGS